MRAATWDLHTVGVGCLTTCAVFYMHLGRLGPWAGLGIYLIIKGISLQISRAPLYIAPHADSGFAAISPMRPAAVSKKEAFSGREHPVASSPVGAR